MDKYSQYLIDLSKFNCTKNVSGYLEIDEQKSMWLIRKAGIMKYPEPPIYRFEDIIDYEIIENGESIRKGGLGSAVVGGLLFGGAGAIVGGVVGKKKNVESVNQLKVKITVNDSMNPVWYIDLISSATKSNSWIYKTYSSVAQEIISALAFMENRVQKSNVLIQKVNISIADELVKFKHLLEQGIINSEEYEEQKRRLLQGS